MQKLLLSLASLLSIFPIASYANLRFEFAEPTGAWWTSPQVPELTVKVINEAPCNEDIDFTLEIYTDKGQFVESFAQHRLIQALDSATLSYKFHIAPGFYKCKFSNCGNLIKQYNIGIDPERIYAPSDAEPDFDTFWEKARNELNAIALEFTMVEDTALHSKVKRGYHVTMKSLGDELLRCYLLVPRIKGKHRAIIHFQGYNQGPWHPDADSRPEYIEFVLSVRGQGWNKPYNTHGTWFSENLDNPNTYYYRGAYMDVIRGIDFVWSLPEFDGKNLFAEGLSQGGLLTLVAGALDDRVVALASCCPFLGDIPSYRQLGSDYMKKLISEAITNYNLTESRFRHNVSYFDLKNLCPKIKVPVMLSVGLQDPICAPYTNFAGYNAISSPKEFVIYPHMQHNVDKAHWERAHLQFFNRYAK